MNEQLAELAASQKSALGFVRDSALKAQSRARERIERLLRDYKIPTSCYYMALRNIGGHARIALHFHPDRLTSKGSTVAESLLEDGHYRNQFETGVSSGSRSAYPGGARDRWEARLFGGAYASPAIPAAARPKYGTLDLMRHPDGPSPRFGSCYFILKTSVSSRSTFTYTGSEQELALERAGTLELLDGVMAALLEEIHRAEGTKVAWPPYKVAVLGVESLTVPGLVDHLHRVLPSAPLRERSRPPGRVLDSYIEAQIHGSVSLSRDVECLVIDPSFEGTPSGEMLTRISREFEFPCRSHMGFLLRTTDVTADFRGPLIPKLAEHIANGRMLSAAILGEAERTLDSQPERWERWGTREQVHQYFRQLWHVLVHLG